MQLTIIDNPITTFGKNDNGCYAETLLATIGELSLFICTSKNTSKGTLDTRASCRKIGTGGSGFSTYTVRLFQDFSAVVDRDTVRCTEKAVRTQHTQSLAHKQDTIDCAYAHYTSADYIARYGKE